MSKCIECNEVELKNPKAKFCSDRCRMRHKRANNPNTEKPEQDNPNSLPLDVIETINRLTTNPDGSINEQERLRRTAIATNYQRLYPDELSNEDVIHTDQEFTKTMTQAKPGHVRVSKPGDADYKPLCETTRRWMANR
jgi:hypothetical protein